jgi:hypothetical protein
MSSLWRSRYFVARAIPSNIWEYDVLDVFPFTTPEEKAMAKEAKRGKAPAPPQ